MFKCFSHAHPPMPCIGIETPMTVRLTASCPLMRMRNPKVRYTLPGSFNQLWLHHTSAVPVGYCWENNRFYLRMYLSVKQSLMRLRVATTARLAAVLFSVGFCALAKHGSSPLLVVFFLTVPYLYIFFYIFHF